MKYLSFLVFLFILFSCTKKKPQENSVSSEAKELHFADNTFEYLIETDTTAGGTSCTIKSISILRKTDHELIQKITPDENSYPCDFDTKDILIIEDINFDGLNDIRIIQFLPATPNIPYFYWVYDKNTNQFKVDDTLDEVPSPEFDQTKKTITSSWRSGCCSYGTNVFQYIDNKLTLIESSNITAIDPGESDSVITTKKKLIDGKMVTVDSTRGVQQ